MSSRSTSKGQCRFTKVGSTPLVPFDNGDSRPADLSRFAGSFYLGQPLDKNLCV